MSSTGKRGPDKQPRKGSPRRGRKVAGNPVDKSPSRAKRARFIDLVTTEAMSPRHAAEAIGVGVTTAYNWMQIPAVAAEIDRRNTIGIEAARARFKAAAESAADTMIELMAAAPDEVVSDGDKIVTRRGRHDPVRKAAAESVLSHVGLGVTQEVKVSADLNLLPDLSKLTPEQLVAIARPGES